MKASANHVVWLKPGNEKHAEARCEKLAQPHPAVNGRSNNASRKADESASTTQSLIPGRKNKKLPRWNGRGCVRLTPERRRNGRERLRLTAERRRKGRERLRLAPERRWNGRERLRLTAERRRKGRERLQLTRAKVGEAD